MGRAELTRPIQASDVEEIKNIVVDLRDLTISAELEVLDVGAGGESVIFRSLGREIYGLESAEEEMNITREKGIEDIVGAKIHWIQGDAREMPLDDRQFDVVTSFFTCMYMRDTENKQKMLNECYRVLKADGVLYLWDFSITTLKQVFVGKLEILLPGDQAVSVSYGIGGEEKEQSLEGMKEIAANAGFTLLQEEVNSPYFFLKFGKK
ncbi:hypothetical protein BHU72_10535 [Desulfuribacillus stibiiarsenatis]|uniref:Methyltransferase type 11 domain-containing protein n=1 Tax=Desulfuribacillus stibiiarsenatis TaxID=1390249 RepID=A0A1E5L951_9FIRM|nr:class I SAM-dependent methyltransferase [Desulfuribacillus stibiiarsenatis]OEH86675.1 hypothetical protein BHU72_10535 [Desulfuribacillus stibiiarsenatis]